MAIALRLVIGLTIGFCIGLSGVGGGVLVLPALTLGLLLPPSTAVGTANLFAFVTKIYGAYRHFRLKTIAFRTAVPFLAGAIPSNVIVAFLINRLAESSRTAAADSARFQSRLTLFIASVIFCAALMLIVNLVAKARRAAGTGGAIAETLARHPTARIVVTVLMGLLVGGLIGSTAIGGGVVIIPLLIILLGFSASHTVGTSIFVTLVLNLITALIYGGGGGVDARTALLMAAGSLAGVHWGSKLSVSLPDKLLQGIMMAAILLSAILMAVKRTTA